MANLLLITVCFNLVHKIICKKTFYQRKIDLEQFSDEEQHSRFGLSLELIKICDRNPHGRSPKTDIRRNHALSPTLKVFLGLSVFVRSSFFAKYSLFLNWSWITVLVNCEIISLSGTPF